AAGRARHAAARLGRPGVGPLRPRMAVERVLAARLPLLGELLAQRCGAAARHARGVQRPFLVAERAQGGVHAVRVPAGTGPGHSAVGGARVRDLEPGALVRAVLARPGLGDHAVETGPLELLEPLPGDDGVAGHGGDVDRLLGAPEHAFQPLATLRERTLAQVLVVL